MNNLLEIFKNDIRYTKKVFGQHFLTNQSFLDKIVLSAEISKDDNVIEIGPGCGVLTAKILETGAKLIAIEIDNEMVEFLKKNLSIYPNFSIINDDATKVNLHEIVGDKTVTVVGNLPYNLSVKILEKTFEIISSTKCSVFMFQKEVADRINAKPNSKIYSSLSIFASYFTDIKKIADINGNNFYPNANVRSTLLKFIPKAKLLPIEDEKGFFELIRKSFTQKRKTLKNNLRYIDNIDDIIIKINKPKSVRAEELSLLDFIALYKAIKTTEI